MHRHKLCRNLKHGKADRAAYRVGQGGLAALQRVRGFLHVFCDRRVLHQQVGTIRRQAVKQSRAKVAFKLPESASDGRLRHLQMPRGCESCRPARREEHPHVVPIHCHRRKPREMFLCKCGKWYAKSKTAQQIFLGMYCLMEEV